MKKVIRLSESDLVKLVERVLHEQQETGDLEPGQTRQCDPGTKYECLKGVKGNIRFDLKSIDAYHGKNIYKVQLGDTVSEILKKHGVSLEPEFIDFFMKTNKMNGNEKSLRPNDVVLVGIV